MSFVGVETNQLRTLRFREAERQPLIGFIPASQSILFHGGLNKPIDPISATNCWQVYVLGVARTKRVSGCMCASRKDSLVAPQLQLRSHQSDEGKYEGNKWRDYLRTHLELDYLCRFARLIQAWRSMTLADSVMLQACQKIIIRHLRSGSLNRAELLVTAKAERQSGISIMYA